MNKTWKANSWSTKIYLCLCWPASRLHVVDKYPTFRLLRWLSGLLAVLSFETEWRAWWGKEKCQLHLFSASDPTLPKDGLWRVPLWSAQRSLYTINSFSGLQSKEKPSKGSTPNGNYPVESEVEDKDEKDEEKEVDDSMYETEEESTPETESDQDSDWDKNEPSR